MKWNLTYSELSAKEHENYGKDLEIEVCSNCGVIVVRDNDGQEKWRSDYGFPIIGVYRHWLDHLNFTANFTRELGH